MPAGRGGADASIDADVAALSRERLETLEQLGYGVGSKAGLEETFAVWSVHPRSYDPSSADGARKLISASSSSSGAPFCSTPAMNGRLKTRYTSTPRSSKFWMNSRGSGPTAST